MFIKTVICNQYSNSFEAKQENKLPVNKAKFIAINKSNNAFITTNSLKVAQKYNKNAVYAIYEINYSYMITYRINENTPAFFSSLREVETRYFNFKCILTQDNNAMRSIKANKEHKKQVLINHLSNKYQYSNENKENKQVFINILCNMLKMKNISLSNFYYVYKYFLLNYVNNEIENYIDNIGLKALTYKQNKIKYHINNNNDLENLDNKIVTTTLKNTALYDYLINEDTKNCFTNTELYQQIKICEIEAKKKANNIIDNIYSYHFLSYLLTHKTEKQVYIALKNKDIIYYFDELLKIRLSIYKAINNCKVEARKNKLMYYYHCLNCINEINEKYQSDYSLEVLEQTLFNKKVA